ncbi:MAG: hypothetical protein VKM98_08430 [Cyanobacteriota bacterium]|nr:hypothetical protein [Cyanobacteriota bacterium]
MGSLALRTLTIAATVGVTVLPGLAVRAEANNSGWTEIPTRISGVTMRFKKTGCQNGICTIEVASNVPGDTPYTENINCDKQQIQTISGGKPGPWLRVDRGSVDEVKFHKICHQH